MPDIFGGFAHGLRHRAALRNPELSRFYRHNFETYASPWWLLRPAHQLVRELPREILAHGLRVEEPDRSGGRREQYLRERALFYPSRAAVLEFSPAPMASPVASSPWTA